MMRNWKTTITGVILAILTSALPYMETGEVNYKALAISAGIAVLGYFAKDKELTKEDQPKL